MRPSPHLEAAHRPRLTGAVSAAAQSGEDERDPFVGDPVEQVAAGVMESPADHEGAPAVLREAVDLGIAHIDTADAYGPHVTNRLIREALYPYPASLHVVTKVGATRDEQGGWPPARRPEDLRRAVRETSRTSAWRCSTWSTSASATPWDPGPARWRRRSGRWPTCGGRA